MPISVRVSSTNILLFTSIALKLLRSSSVKLPAGSCELIAVILELMLVIAVAVKVTFNLFCVKFAIVNVLRFILQ